MNRTPARLAVAAAVAALTVSGCAGKSPTATTPDQTVPSAAASSTAAAAGQTISITYAAGKVTGVPARVTVKQGSAVSLVVTSDAADEVHLHGYDLHADVAKGGTITLTFTAKLPGIFEVELEKLKRRLVTLQVS